MKNLSAILKIFVLAAVIIFPANVSAANLFQIYDSYDRDSNYILGASYANGRTYIEWRTITVVQYNPPHYQISARAVNVVYDMRSEEIDAKNFLLEKRFNWDTKETFTRTDYGNWEKDEVVGNHTPCRQNRRIADILFRAAYGMNFYGY